MVDFETKKTILKNTISALEISIFDIECSLRANKVAGDIEALKRLEKALEMAIKKQAEIEKILSELEKEKES